jgi:hypothetical protein
MSQPRANPSDPVRESKAKSDATEAQGGYEKSADRDAKSNQAPGKHSRETELKIARQMPDRK